MLIFDAKWFIELLDLLAQHEQVLSDLSGRISLEAFELGKKSAESIEKRCIELELNTSARVAKQSALAGTYEEKRFEAKHLRKTIIAEMSGRKFYGPIAVYAPYFENSKPFGDEVFDAFPSANDDLTEAATCLALERSTACVMHLMRAMEVVLAVLAKTLGVERQNDWGSYLREIERELAKRAKIVGARTPDEQFYAEATTSFDAVRRAWRNPTMHVEKIYSQQCAEDIFRAVKSFMYLLATKIAEETF